MKSILFSVMMLFNTVTLLASTGTQRSESISQDQKSGEVISMNKELFKSLIFDFEKADQWKYKGIKPAIIDLYADWCAPCRMVAPIMKELAKEYADEIVIYKVNVDKEKELASFFNASSIPLFVFIPTEGTPQLMKGAADKSTYKKVIDSFLLGK